MSSIASTLTALKSSRAPWNVLALPTHFFRRLFIWLIYTCATLQFVRYYVVSTTFYLDMSRYSRGMERLPFQERVLPIVLMWPLNHSALLMRHLTHPDKGFDAASASTHDKLAFYILSLLSFTIASLCVQKLYSVASRTGAMSYLVFPLFMVLTLWTYVVHIDANFSFPYDMPSLAFFAAGLLAIYTRHFWPLVVIVFVGTFNRETTLFLIGIYLIDSATIDLADILQPVRHSISLRERFDLRLVSWWRISLLLTLWIAVKGTLAYHFRFNDNSENFVRLWGNIGRLRPRLWPALLDMCGYIIPIIVIFRNRLRPVRFANYLYILPIWIAVMLYTGVILEARIYGELCSYVAVASVLLIEEDQTVATEAIERRLCSKESSLTSV